MAVETQSERLIRHVSEAERLKLDEEFISNIRRRALDMPIAQWVLAEVIVLCPACEIHDRTDANDLQRRGNASAHGARALIHVRNFKRSDNGSFDTVCPKNHAVTIQSLPVVTELMVNIHLEQVERAKVRHPSGDVVTTAVSAA